MDPARAYAPYVEEFNRGLRAITMALARQCPHDPMVYRAKQRVMTVLDLDPLYVIREVGPYLYSYRGQIYAAGQPGQLAAVETFFMANSFDAELKASVDMEKADLVAYIIPRVKDYARTVPDAEKHQWARQIIALLDNYVEFLSAWNGLPQ
jgi:hypothetical protein